MLCSICITDSRKHICNRITHRHFLVLLPDLPTGFLYARDLALVSQLSEAHAADTVFLKHAVRAAADSAAGVSPRGEFGFALLLDLHCCFCHDNLSSI